MDFGIVHIDITALLIGTIFVEALLEIILDCLTNKSSIKNIRLIGAVLGIVIAILLDINIVRDAKMYQQIIGTVITGLIMSRSSEWIHSLIKALLNVKNLISDKNSSSSNVKNIK